MLAEIEESTKENLDKCDDAALWVGSILYYQQGKYQKSFEFLSALVKRKPSDIVFLTMAIAP